MTLSIINYGISGSPLANDYLIRHVQAAEASKMEDLAAAMSAEVVAINTDIDDAPEEYTPADANLAGAGDGHTFIYTVTFVRRRLNYAVPSLLAFTAGLLTPVSVLQSPGPGAVNVLPYTGGGTPIVPPIVPGPEFFVTKFCLASEAEAMQIAFADMVTRALKDVGVPPGLTAPALWQQIVGGAKGTRFMGGVSVLGLPQQP